jgi:ABC-2 type transport system permease protein
LKADASHKSRYFDSSAAFAGAPSRVSGWRKFLVDLRYIWIEQILEVRDIWYIFVIFSLLMPLSMVFGFARMGSGLNDRTSLLYIITGSAIFTVANEGIAMFAGRVGEMKRDGLLLYYATLPISKTAFILAVLLSRLVLTIPGMLAAMAAGAWLYEFEIVASPWILIVLLLAGVALATIGMIIGVAFQDYGTIVAVTNIALFVLLLAAPIFIPAEALPLPLQLLAYLLPPTYAADALRHALAGTIGQRFFIDLALLLLLTLIGLGVVDRWLSWRVA